MIKKLLRKNRLTDKILETYFISKEYLSKKGWYESRFLHQSIDENKDPLPWFTYSAINFIENKLLIKPMKVFEYGSGNSTLWFSQRVKQVVSVENDADYYKQMYKVFDLMGNISHKLLVESDKYSSEILNYENEFDIVIIDGRERVKCTLNSIKALKPDGIIIFDNSERQQYKRAYDYLKDSGFKRIDFKGHAPIIHAETQTTVFYKDDNCFDI